MFTYLFCFCGYFQSSTANTPARTFRLNMSNDMVGRKEVPVGGQKNKI